jgi:hypothetical protein
MIRAYDIRQKLALLAQNKISLNAFEVWLEPYVWDVDEDSAPDVQDLMYSIQLLFSERNNRRLNAAALRRELSLVLNKILVSAPIDIPAQQPEPRANRFGVNAANLQVQAQVLVPLSA